MIAGITVGREDFRSVVVGEQAGTGITDATPPGRARAGKTTALDVLPRIMTPAESDWLAVAMRVAG